MAGFVDFVIAPAKAPRAIVRFAAAAVALIAFACAAAQGARAAPLASVPFYINEEGSMSVSVFVNGNGPYEFVIDTGATMSLVFENLATIEDFTPTGGPLRRVIGILGSGLMATYKIGDLSVGGAVLNGHIGVVMPDWAPPRHTPSGVLGVDFFQKYGAVFDVDARVMTLYPAGGIPGEVIRRWRKVDLKAAQYANAAAPLFSTRGKINRSATTFIIDLGSGTTLINYRAAESLFSQTVATDLNGSATTGSRLNDLFDDREKLRTGRLDRVSVGAKTWKSVRVFIHNAPIFDEIGVQKIRYGLLGADILAKQDFAIDFGERRLYLSRS